MITDTRKELSFGADSTNLKFYSEYKDASGRFPN